MDTAASAQCALFTHEFKGAASRVPAEATAFGLRRDHVLVEILATFVDRSDKEEEQRHRQWAQATRGGKGALGPLAQYSPAAIQASATISRPVEAPRRERTSGKGFCYPNCYPDTRRIRTPIVKPLILW